MTQSIQLRAALAFLFAFPVCGQLPPATKTSIDEAVEKVLAKTGVPSASIAIVRDGKVAYAQAYGMARLAGKVRATPQMRYKIGSNSKQITATAMLLLAGEGKVSLDDPVARFFPELTQAGEISIRQLLSHTSGYEDYYALDYVAPYMALPTTPRGNHGYLGEKTAEFRSGHAVAVQQYKFCDCRSDY